MDVWTTTIRDARRCTMIEGLEHLVSIRIAHHYSDTSHRKVAIRYVQAHQLDKIKNFHLEIQVSSLTLALG